MNSKQKGSNFEREVCVKLSKWISYDERDDIFWRSAMSGGRTTVGLKKGITRNTQAGDITAIDPIGNKLTNTFMIECKFYRNIQLQSLMFGMPKNNSIFEFWTKLYKDSLKLNKDMMLIIKQNGWPILMGLTFNSQLRYIIDNDYGVEPLVTFTSIIPTCLLYDFDLVLKEVDYAVISQIK